MTGRLEHPAGQAVLGIDTSMPVTAVCLVRSDGGCFETVPEPAALLGRPGHGRDLLPQVVRQLGAAGVELGDLDSIAVGTGPGGYTGLRIGIATARSLAQAQRLPLRPVGSLAALAAGIDAPAALALIDARRGELFASLHTGGEERWPPFVAPVDEVVARLEAALRKGLPAPLAAGDGSLRFRHDLEAAGIEVAPPDSGWHAVRALHICRLAAEAPALAPEAVVPTYLRDPDAAPR